MELSESELGTHPFHFYTESRNSCSVEAMDSSPPFRPLTKEAIAEVLSVSPRTIEHWVDQELMPPPASIGNRVFWHPDIFYSWLDQRLRQPKTEPTHERAIAVTQIRQRGAAVELSQLREKARKRIANIQAGHNSQPG